jgi:hypothetical protein
MKTIGIVVTMCAALAVAAPEFEAVQPELFGVGGALSNAWADYDGDGDLDLFVSFGGNPANRLYRNDAGVFRDVAAEAGVADARATRAAAWADADADGDADLIVGFAPGPEPLLRFYRNERGRFVDATRDVGLVLDSGAVRQFSWIDLDVDGDLDLFLALRDRPNALFRNDGGRFTNIAATIGLDDRRKTVGAVWFDYDADGDLDVYVANQDGDANGLFRNDGGRFTDIADAAGLAWGGRTAGLATNGSVRPCVADVDNDGRLDLFLANYGKNGLFLNRGSGRFEDVSAPWGVAIDARYDTCAFADYDNDGSIDLYVNGTVGAGTSYRDFLFRNTGTKFEDVTPANLLVQHASHGAQWADFDIDGDLDLAIAGSRADATHALFRNRLPDEAARRSLQIVLANDQGMALLPGAEVRLYAAGSRRLIGTRLVDTGSGYNSQNIAPLHFGLPDKGRIDVEVTLMSARGRVTRRWPGVDPAGKPVLELRVSSTGR